MKQLTQKLKTGNLKILEVPGPALKKGHILVKNHYSLISVGTEISTVKSAKKSYIGKAKERPQQFKQVVDSFKNAGPLQTYRTVMKKLDSYSPLGYSCSGEVIEVSADVKEFKVGDFVACGGLSASHAEVVAIPKNLGVKLKPYADLKQAAYNTLGATALQGVRQTNLRLGENCAIIGLGLIGQITALLLCASGIRVVGIDIDQDMVCLAERHCVELAMNRSNAGIKDKIDVFTDSLGCDAVIVTAASDSHDPINFAGAISRKRGTIVVVGDVPTGFDREPHYFKKELQVKMSCSYGPGRYDPEYEQKGIDYPPAYVRWTEKRNMQAFQQLIHSKKIDVSHLTTHTFKLEEAPAAYDMILAKSEPYLGILIEYDIAKKIDLSRRKINLKLSSRKHEASAVNIGFIGAGSYAQGHLLPNISKNKNISLKGVMTETGTSSSSVAERFGFEFCTTNAEDIIENDEINTIFIATRHDSHARYVLETLKAGKHVFVEKPLCLRIEQLNEIYNLFKKNPEHCSKQILMVGYNRRFSPFGILIKKEFGNGPMAINYRINAGPIKAESWIQDDEFGGGRIIGEVCHFVDFLTFMSGSIPTSVYAQIMEDSRGLNDTVNISLSYENGSVGSISYFSNGNTSMPKERCEIFSNGSVAVINDFKKLSIYSNGKKRLKKILRQNKGQKLEIECFLKAITDNLTELIPLKEILSSSEVTFKIIESSRKKKCIRLK